jgi:hypothetical protein
MHPKLRDYLKREKIDTAAKCIDLDKVPCPGARAQILKEGLACAHSVKISDVPKKAKRKKSFLDEWFG